MRVDTTAKSTAIASPRWLARNVRQRWEGGFWGRVRYLETVDSETRNPSLRSSPWIRGAPQVGFASAIFRMRARISPETFGRPGRRGRLFQRQ